MDEVRVAVIVATLGRPDCVRHLVDTLSRQSRLPDYLIFSVTKPEDVGFDAAAVMPEGVTVDVLVGKKGLTVQRNAALDHLAGRADIAVFFDDDFVPSRYALQGIVTAFSAMPDVSGMTGYLIADGIHGAGFREAEAIDLVDAYDAERKGPSFGTDDVLRSDLVGLYGCNMAYRLSMVGDIRFDDALPLYAWLEDVDFAARLPGRRIKTSAFAGVHRGHKSSREVSGSRLGYSQIVNPFYLWKKGTVPKRLAFRLAARNFLANQAKQFAPEPWIDRRGRARGNWRALWDILAGRSHPSRILDM